MPETAERKPSIHPTSARKHELVGKHSARCRAAKHEDWQHGLSGCAVGSGEGHCDCTVHWVEARPRPTTRSGGLGQ